MQIFLDVFWPLCKHCKPRGKMSYLCIIIFDLVNEAFDKKYGMPALHYCGRKVAF